MSASEDGASVALGTSEGAGAGSISSVTASSNESGRLELENKRLRERMNEMREAFYAKKGAGKNKTKEKEVLTRQDLMNVNIAFHAVRKVIFRKTKIMPKQWSMWSEKERSVSQVVMKDLVTPVGWTSKDYWLLIIRGQISKKLCSMRSNLKEQLKNVYIGKNYALIHTYISFRRSLDILLPATS